MKGIVDRFEGGFAVIEIGGTTVDIPRAMVDPAVKAGDCVMLTDGKWVADAAATANRTRKIKQVMDQLWED